MGTVTVRIPTPPRSYTRADDSVIVSGDTVATLPERHRGAIRIHRHAEAALTHELRFPDCEIDGVLSPTPPGRQLVGDVAMVEERSLRKSGNETWRHSALAARQSDGFSAPLPFCSGC